MKKLIFITLLSAIALNVSSCKKEEDKAPSLTGTSWFASGTESGYTWTTTINFLSESAGMVIYTDSDYDNETFSFTYTYAHPNVMFSIPGDGAYTGVVNGNSMTFMGDTYTKK